MMLFRGTVLAMGLVLSAGGQPVELMPRAEDYTSTWWADGFPSVVPGAAWERVVRTGRYAMVLDTEKMVVRHFGAVAGGSSYGGRGDVEREVVEALPGAELELAIDVNGERYRCVAGGEWGRHVGPRLVEAGRFFQRADVTDLVFESAAGERLNVEARFEVAAWADRLGLKLVAEPGWRAIEAGEGAFGKTGGGFGLDGGNAFEVAHSAAIDGEAFSLELWAFVPGDYRVSERTWPWLVCKNRNEAADGNYGIMIVDGKVQGRMNIGGGKAGQVVVGSREVEIDAWNHLVLCYDGEWLRLFLNGREAGGERVGKVRKAGRDALVFGRRGDNSGDGYPFRGVVDEIRMYDRALGEGEVRQRSRGGGEVAGVVGRWGFREDGMASEGKLRERWDGAELAVRMGSRGRLLGRRAKGGEVGLALDPVAFEEIEGGSPVVVEAGDRPVVFEPVLGWHRINLDGIEPVVPEGDGERRNDAMERVRFTLKNPGGQEEVARLMFEKTARGIRQRIGSAITGVSAVLCDAAGRPTGIPVQLSKNWHRHPMAGAYAGQWFHGVSQVRLPAGAEVELQLVMVYGHWGGVAAASHAQLSLIGWGANQRWDQSALGSWGESICYEPEQVQANCSITDVRPVMVVPKSGRGEWSWTNNVGGGDFLRLFDLAGERVGHSAMRAAYLRQGPCLTEVRYSGRAGEGIRHSQTVSLARTDDVVRGVFRVRMDVGREVAFSRLVIFQVGADSYNFTRERKMALGNEAGLVREWETTPGGDVYRTEAMECVGRVPWISLHEGERRREGESEGAWANRGIVIREWEARLGGKTAAPWVAEHAVTRHGMGTSTIDVVPPPGVARLRAGDFVEAVFEYVVMPQSAEDYYGPNAELRAALGKDGNTWRMIEREAVGNPREVSVEAGELERLWPDVRVAVDGGRAALGIEGGLGYVPVSFSGLESAAGYELRVDGKVVDQSVHGNDFWQTDYDPESRRWSRTYTVPLAGGRSHRVELSPKPLP